jgi:hypothetical protein
MPELRYHHVGIPTDRPLPKEDYIEQFKVYASGYFQSPYGVEWMKFEPGCDLPELVKTVPHVAFVVDDIRAAIAGKEILIEPNCPAEGVTVAFIVDNGAPIEFLQFDRPECEIWPKEAKFRTPTRTTAGGITPACRRHRIAPCCLLLLVSGEPDAIR